MTRTQDAAIARFEQLSRPARLENAASQVCERYLAHYAARDWAAMAEILAHDFSSDDRRRVVSAGVRHGRDAQIANMQAFAALAIARVTSTSIAIRGERLVLQRVRFSDRDQTTDAFLTERLGVGEINAEGRIAAFVSFDLDDVDAAFEELESRYLAGEAAPFARVWKSGMETVARNQPPRAGTKAERARVCRSRTRLVRVGRRLWPVGRGVVGTRTRRPAIGCRARTLSMAAEPWSAWSVEGTDKQGNELQWRRTLLFACEGPRLEVIRGLRRGRRRRARSIRGTSPAHTATGKLGNPRGRALSCALRGRRLGRNDRVDDRRLFQ